MGLLDGIYDVNIGISWKRSLKLGRGRVSAVRRKRGLRQQVGRSTNDLAHFHCVGYMPG